jgi:hypothetical protein
MAYGTVKVDNITFDNGGSDQNVTVSGLYRATTSGVTVSGTIVAATVSGVTIIGSTTVSGATVTGTTANFTSGNFSNIISSAATMSGALIMANQQQVRFREAVGNGVNHIALQAPAIVSADQTITLPDQTGTVVTTGDNGSVSSTMLATNLTISAAAGSATTPSIAFTGDPNTGIYSPGADQLAVATNGTGRLFVASDGSVGIGTSALATVPLLLNDTGNGLVLQNAASGNYAIGLLAGTGSQDAYIYQRANAPLIIGTNNTERLRITSAGLVGIGTASPGEKLHVSGIILGDSNDNYFGSYSSGGAYLDVGNLATSATWIDARSTSLTSVPVNIRAKGTGEIIFHQTSGEKVRIDSSGRVGIGTSSPGYALDVAAADTTASTGYAVRIRANATAGAGALQFTDSAATVQYGLLVFDANGVGTLQAEGASSRLAFSTNAIERLRIDSSGNVGIGTSSPTATLDVNGDVKLASINGGPLAGFRNRTINGNFDIWQRGTSFTGSEYTADRWINTRVGTTHTASRQGFTPGENSVANEPTYYCRTIVTSVAGASNLSYLEQRIEDVRTFAGQQVTISLWARVDATKNISVELEQVFGTGGSPSASVQSIGVTKVSIGTSWQKVTVTATVPSISGKTLGSNNDHHLKLGIWFDAGSDFNARTDSLGQQSGTFDIAQVQIEPGAVATPFEQRPIGTELALCQRYFYRVADTNITLAPPSITDPNSFGFVTFPVTMRAHPTTNISSAGAGGVTVPGTYVNGFAVIKTGGGGTYQYVASFDCTAEL